MKKITIKKVPKNKIRNNGIGDYFKKGNGIEIRVANLRDKDAETGVAVHEMVESMLADKRGIKFRDIDKWDREHVKSKGEPGEMKGSPYSKEHTVANMVEKILIKELKKKK